MGPIYEDSRQQRGKHDHIEQWMRAHGVEFEPRARALPFGDYMRDGSNVSVDTKKDVQELVMDVGRDHARFARECERARDAGYRLVVLVESSARYNDERALAGWTSTVCGRCRRCDPRRSTGCRMRRAKPMQGAALVKILRTMTERHGVAFEFCPRRAAAQRICELLGVPYG